MGRKDAQFFKKEGDGYVYTGKYYFFKAYGPRKIKRAHVFTALFAIMLCAFLVMGVTDKGQTRYAYVTFPYVAGLLPAALGFAGAVALHSMPERLTIVQYKRGARRIRNCARGGMATGLMTLIGSVICAAYTGFSASYLPFMAASVVYLLCACAAERIYALAPAQEVAAEARPQN